MQSKNTVYIHLTNSDLWNVDICHTYIPCYGYKAVLIWKHNGQSSVNQWLCQEIVAGKFSYLADF